MVVTLFGYYRTNALTTCRLFIAIIGQSTAFYLSGYLEAKMDSQVDFLHGQVPSPHLCVSCSSPSRWKGSTMLNMAMGIRYMISMDPQLMMIGYLD